MTIVLALSYACVVGLLASRAFGHALAWAWQRVDTNAGIHPWALAAPTLARVGLGFGAFVGLASLFPARPWTWLSGLCACQAFGGLHVCPFHFQQAAWVLAIIAPITASLLLIRRQDLFRAIARHRDVQLLGDAIGPQTSDVMVSAQVEAPTAFVAGLWPPRIVVAQSWWNSLASREQGVILAHESGHITHNDPWNRAVLDVVLAFIAPSARERILADWELAAELQADRAAVTHDGDPVYVATVLCRYARAASPPATIGLGGQALEIRVRALLDGQAPQQPRQPTWRMHAALWPTAFGLGHLVHRSSELLLGFLA